MRTVAVLITCAVMWGQAHSQAAASLIVEGGKSNFVIVVPGKPDRVERFAAEELQQYIEKMTSSTLEIVTNQDARPAIAVGDTQFGKQLNVPSRHEFDDAFAIRTIDGNLVLKGANPRATLFAVYAFLEKQGCWFFSPGTDYLKPHHEIIPQASSLKLEQMNVLEQPLMKYRKKDADTARSLKGEAWAATIDWAAKNRINTLACWRSKYEADREIIARECARRGIRIEVGKHGLMRDFLPDEKYFEQHPDWFGYIDGKRTTKARNREVMFETANPEAVAEFEKNLFAWLAERPEIDGLQLWPPDGCEWSESTESLKLGSPEERMALLVQHVHDSMVRAGIKKDMVFLAYSNYLQPPQNMKFRKDAIVDFCPINRSFAKPMCDESDQKNTTYCAALKQWVARFPGQITHYSYYGKYSWGACPVALPSQIAVDMKAWHSAGECGAGMYTEPGSWLPLEVNHLAMARASWDPQFDADQWYSGYLKARFSEAAEPVRRYYDAATSFSLMALIAQSAHGDPIQYKPLLDQARVALDDARTNADTPMAKWYLEKIAWQPEYMALALEVRSAGRDKKDAARAAFDKMKQLADTHRNDGTFVGTLVVRERGL